MDQGPSYGSGSNHDIIKNLCDIDPRKIPEYFIQWFPPPITVIYI